MACKRVQFSCKRVQLSLLKLPSAAENVMKLSLLKLPSAADIIQYLNVLPPRNSRRSEVGGRPFVEIGLR